MPVSPGAAPRWRPAGSPQRLRSRAGMNARVGDVARARASVIGELSKVMADADGASSRSTSSQAMGSKLARIAGAITRPAAVGTTPYSSWSDPDPYSQGAEAPRHDGRAQTSSPGRSGARSDRPVPWMRRRQRRLVYRLQGLVLDPRRPQVLPADVGRRLLALPAARRSTIPTVRTCGASSTRRSRSSGCRKRSARTADHRSRRAAPLG